MRSPACSWKAAAPACSHPRGRGPFPATPAAGAFSGSCALLFTPASCLSPPSGGPSAWVCVISARHRPQQVGLQVGPPPLLHARLIDQGKPRVPPPRPPGDTLQHLVTLGGGRELVPCCASLLERVSGHGLASRQETLPLPTLAEGRGLTDGGPGQLTPRACEQEASPRAARHRNGLLRGLGFVGTARRVHPRAWGCPGRELSASLPAAAPRRSWGGGGPPLFPHEVVSQDSSPASPRVPREAFLSPEEPGSPWRRVPSSSRNWT